MTFSSLNSQLDRARLPTNEAEMASKPLGAEAFRKMVSGKVGTGLYRAPFSYEMRLNADGSLWGRNNYGTEDHGQWVIADTGEMTVSWQSYWDAHTTRGYADGGVLHQFDVATGHWRTSMVIPAA